MCHSSKLENTICSPKILTFGTVKSTIYLTGWVSNLEHPYKLNRYIFELSRSYKPNKQKNFVSSCLNTNYGLKYNTIIMRTGIFKNICCYTVSQIKVDQNLLPDFARLREKTKTSAPSLIVLVLKPLPSIRQ